MSVPSMCFLLKIEITLLLRNINEKHIFIQTAPYRLYRIPCTYCSSVHKNRYDHQKHQKPTSLKIADEKGNSKKNQLKMKREFLNTLYSSSYTGAGALCSTSVDLVYSLTIQTVLSRPSVTLTSKLFFYFLATFQTQYALDVKSQKGPEKSSDLNPNPISTV